MKVKICPICGKKLDGSNWHKTLLCYGDIFDKLVGSEDFCSKCGRVIPLVTPKEEK